MDKVAIERLRDELQELKSLCEDIEQAAESAPEQITDASFWKHYQATERIKALYYAAFGRIGTTDLGYVWVYSIKKALGEKLHDEEYLKRNFWDLEERRFKPEHEFAPDSNLIAVRKQVGASDKPYVVLTLRSAYGNVIRDAYLDIDLPLDKKFRTLQDFCEFKTKQRKKREADRDGAIWIWMKIAFFGWIAFVAIRWVANHWY